MNRLLKHEFFKLFRSKGVLVAVGISFLLTIALTALFNVLGVGFGSFETNFGISNAYLSSTWSMFAIVIIISIVVSDHSRGIVRNMVLAGYSRYKVYLSKYIVCIVLAIVMALFSTLVFTFFADSSMSFGIGFEPIKLFYGVLLTLLQTIAYVTIAFFIAYMTRNIGASIGIILGLSAVFGVLQMVATIPTLTDTASKVIQFIGELYAGTLLQKMTNIVVMVDSEALAATSEAIKYILICIITIALFLIAGILKFKKTNLK